MLFLPIFFSGIFGLQLRLRVDQERFSWQQCLVELECKESSSDCSSINDQVSSWLNNQTQILGEHQRCWKVEKNTGEYIYVAKFSAKNAEVVPGVPMEGTLKYVEIPGRLFGNSDKVEPLYAMLFGFSKEQVKYQGEEKLPHHMTRDFHVGFEEFDDPKSESFLEVGHDIPQVLYTGRFALDSRAAEVGALHAEIPHAWKIELHLGSGNWDTHKCWAPVRIAGFGEDQVSECFKVTGKKPTRSSYIVQAVSWGTNRTYFDTATGHGCTLENVEGSAKENFVPETRSSDGECSNVRMVFEENENVFKVWKADLPKSDAITEKVREGKEVFGVDSKNLDEIENLFVEEQKWDNYNYTPVGYRQEEWPRHQNEAETSRNTKRVVWASLRTLYGSDVPLFATCCGKPSSEGQTNALCQGLVGNCWFVAPLMGMDALPVDEQAKFVVKDPEVTGKYSAHLFLPKENNMSNWQTMDDFVPCIEKSTRRVNQYAGAQGQVEVLDGSRFWSPLSLRVLDSHPTVEEEAFKRMSLAPFLLEKRHAMSKFGYVAMEGSDAWRAYELLLGSDQPTLEIAIRLSAVNTDRRGGRGDKKSKGDIKINFVPEMHNADINDTTVLNASKEINVASVGTAFDHVKQLLNTYRYMSAGTSNKKNFKVDGKVLDGPHIYQVLKAEDGKFLLRDPNGKSAYDKESTDGSFEIEAQRFFENFDEIVIPLLKK